MSASHKLGIGIRSTNAVACHHLTFRQVHSNRGLREVSPVHNVTCLLFFGIKSGKTESWPKIKVRSPHYTIIQLYAVITTQGDMQHFSYNLVRICLRNF
jgi:hypothetical protein